jgi:hypothetical protein
MRIFGVGRREERHIIFVSALTEQLDPFQSRFLDECRSAAPAASNNPFKAVHTEEAAGRPAAGE